METLEVSNPKLYFTQNINYVLSRFLLLIMLLQSNKIIASLFVLLSELLSQQVYQQLKPLNSPVDYN